MTERELTTDGPFWTFPLLHQRRILPLGNEVVVGAFPVGLEFGVFCLVHASDTCGLRIEVQGDGGAILGIGAERQVRVFGQNTRQGSGYKTGAIVVDLSTEPIRPGVLTVIAYLNGLSAGLTALLVREPGN